METTVQALVVCGTLLVCALSLFIGGQSKKAKKPSVARVITEHQLLEQRIEECRWQIIHLGLQPEQTKHWRKLPTWAKQRVRSIWNDQEQYALRGHRL